jgi:chromosome segregation ATPase
MSGTEDIVTRLRMLGGLDAALCNKAADEIERLRAERDEYKDAFEFAHKEFHDALDDLAKMKAERDEARRHCCEYAAIVAKADTVKAMETGRFHEVKIKHMRDMGWDCFKEASE